MVDQETVKQIRLAAFIEVWGTVVLTTRPLGRGQPIGPDDVVLKKMDLASAPVNAVVDKNYAVVPLSDDRSPSILFSGATRLNFHRLSGKVMS